MSNDREPMSKEQCELVKLKSALGADYYSIYANKGGDRQGNRIAWLVIACADFQLNLILRPEELDKLPEVKNARWVDRTSLRIGIVHESPAFWSMDENGLSILLGHDDEAWSVSFALPAATLDQMIAVLEPLRPLLVGPHL
jgi:hypothetical protein